jgi:hypothetical protein
MDEREISVGLFLDLSKAYDLVDHDIFLGKMAGLRIRGVAQNWFQSYLENREQTVEITHRRKETNKIINCLSQKKPIRYGCSTVFCSWTNAIFYIYQRSRLLH